LSQGPCVTRVTIAGRGRARGLGVRGEWRWRNVGIMGGPKLLGRHSHLFRERERDAHRPRLPQQRQMLGQVACHRLVARRRGFLHQRRQRCADVIGQQFGVLINQLVGLPPRVGLDKQLQDR